MPTEIITNLSPRRVAAYLETDFATAFEEAGISGIDPNISAKDLNLGYAQQGGWTRPSRAPSDADELYRWEINGDRAVVRPFTSTHEKPVEIELTLRATLTADDVRFLRENPQIVELVPAALGVYKPECVPAMGEIPPDAFDFEANARIFENLRSGGVAHAANLDLKGFEGLKDLLAVAAFMDTACRTPDRMSPALVELVVNWYGQFKDATVWIGAGTEHVPLDKRVDQALAKGEISRDEYLQFRRKQLQLIHDLKKTPILFPDQMQNGLSEEANISILRELLSTYEGEVVRHKLCSPFNPRTDWDTNTVLSGTADLAYAVKTSDPRFENQLQDYGSVTHASKQARSPVVVYTGDDRGFPGDFQYGATQQLKKRLQTGEPDKTYSRNGFTFIKDVNISGLLGYIGLNPFQTIAAVGKLSRWYHEKAKGDSCDATTANNHLKDFWKLMAPAMAMSTDAFFGENDPTLAYTWRVYVANRLTGVLKENDGKVLPHRSTTWTDREDQEILARRMLSYMVVAGAITSRELRDVVRVNRTLLGM